MMIIRARRRPQHVQRAAPRRIVLNRKNALFAAHDQGAGNWPCVASLIETCKANDVEPQACIVGVLDRLVNLWPSSRIDELMPWV